MALARCSSYQIRASNNEAVRTGSQVHVWNMFWVRPLHYSFRPKVFAEPRIQAPPLLLPLLVQITTESGKSTRSR